MALNKKKILLFTDWYYPGYKAGGPIQSCRNLVSALRDEFSFYVVTSNSDSGETKGYTGVPVNQWVGGQSGEQVYYLPASEISVSLIKRMLSDIQPDVVYLNSMFSPRFTILPLLALKRAGFRGKTVLAPRGMLQRGAMAFKPLKKKIFLIVFRMLALHRKLVLHATNQQESKDIQRTFPGARQLLVGNIPATYIPCREFVDKQPGILRMVFFSRIHPIKNLHYALSALPKPLAGQSIRVDVYGHTDIFKYEQQCRDIAAGLDGNIQVRFPGGLPLDEMLEKMPDYHAFILPTLGENFGHAIFEALMSGLPVLISDRTPWRDLQETKAGWDLPLDQPEKFAEAIRELLAMDQPTHQQWRLGARKKAEEYIQKANFKEKYRELFQ